MAKEAKALTHDKEIKGVSKKVHIDSDGNENRSAVAGETEFHMLFSTGEMLVVKRADLSDTIWEAAGWHGLAQKLGDSYAGQKESGDDPYDNASAMLEQLAAGNWISESKSTGPRIGLLVEAVIAALTKAGKTVDEAGIANRMKDKEHAKRAKANPAVAAEYENIVAARAAKKAKDASEKAKGADTTDLEDL